MFNNFQTTIFGSNICVPQIKILNPLVNYEKLKPHCICAAKSFRFLASLRERLIIFSMSKFLIVSLCRYDRFQFSNVLFMSVLIALLINWSDKSHCDNMLPSPRASSSFHWTTLVNSFLMAEHELRNRGKNFLNPRKLSLRHTPVKDLYSQILRLLSAQKF